MAAAVDPCSRPVVELIFKAEPWSWLLECRINVASHNTLFSIDRERTGVTEIGLKSLAWFGFDTFGMGVSDGSCSPLARHNSLC